MRPKVSRRNLICAELFQLDRVVLASPRGP